MKNFNSDITDLYFWKLYICVFKHLDYLHWHTIEIVIYMYFHFLLYWQLRIWGPDPKLIEWMNDGLRNLTELQMLLQAAPSPALNVWPHNVSNCPWLLRVSYRPKEFRSSRGILPSLKLILSMQILNFAGFFWPWLFLNICVDKVHGEAIAKLF